MTPRADERWRLEIGRLAASARDHRVPPEAFIVQVKECVYRARDRPVGTELDAFMACVVRYAIAEYYEVARP